MEEAQKNMKKQFDKKRRNPQGLKVGNNVWLENKNCYDSMLKVFKQRTNSCIE